MTKFILRRLIWTIPVILLVIFLTFVMMRQIEGNPFRLSERNVPESIQKNLEAKFGLDEPWYIQYLTYVKNVFTFDLGPSLVQRNRTVNDIVSEALPALARARRPGVPLRDRRRDPAGGVRGPTGQHASATTSRCSLERRLRRAELPRRDAAHLLLRAQVGRRRADERLDDVGSRRSCP